MNYMDENAVRRRLASMSFSAGGQKKLAERWRLSPSFINDVLLCRRGVSKKLAARMGLERVVVYRSKP